MATQCWRPWRQPADEGDADEEAEAGGEEYEAPAEVGAAESADSEEAGPRSGGGNGDQDLRRNRRRGRRGGRRHRDEIGGAEFGRPQGEAIPGLGEQPVLDFELNFPKNAEMGPVSRVPAAPEQPGAPEPAAEAPVEAAPQLEPQEVPASPPAMALTESAPEPAFEPSPEPEAPAAAVPVQAPKPKPVRTGPRRKGWWQQRAG